MRRVLSNEPWIALLAFRTPTSHRFVSVFGHLDGLAETLACGGSLERNFERLRMLNRPAVGIIAHIRNFALIAAP